MKQINVLVLGRVCAGKTWLIEELNKIVDENHNIVYHESQTIDIKDQYDLILGVFKNDLSKKWLDDVLNNVNNNKPIVYVQTQMNEKDVNIIRLKADAHPAEYASLTQTLLSYNSG